MDRLGRASECGPSSAGAPRAAVSRRTPAVCSRAWIRVDDGRRHPTTPTGRGTRPDTPDRATDCAAHAAPVAAAPEATPAVTLIDAAPAAAPADAPAPRDRRTMGEVLEMAMSLALELRERVLRRYMEELNEE